MFREKPNIEERAEGAKKPSGIKRAVSIEQTG